MSVIVLVTCDLVSHRRGTAPLRTLGTFSILSDTKCIDTDVREGQALSTKLLRWPSDFWKLMRPDILVIVMTGISGNCFVG